MARVLIVEDAKDVAKALAMRVRAQGHEVLVAHDAASGAELVEREHPDLVLLDIGMPPGKDWNTARAGGLVVADRLRKNREMADTPLIFLTASRDASVRRQALHYRPVAFLEKPYDPQVLCAEMAGALAD